MYWCYKIVFGLVDIQPDDFFLLSPVTVTHGHKYKLFKHGSKACVRVNFFAERVINHWNSLPDSVNFSSFFSFERSVQSINFANLLTVSYTHLTLPTILRV